MVLFQILYLLKVLDMVLVHQVDLLLNHTPKPAQDQQNRQMVRITWATCTYNTSVYMPGLYVQYIPA